MWCSESLRPDEQEKERAVHLQLWSFPCTCFLYGDHKEEREDPLFITITTRWSWHAGFVLRLPSNPFLWCFQALFDHLALLILMEGTPERAFTYISGNFSCHPVQEALSCPFCI